MWRQRADVCQGISAAYLELFHSDLTLENVSPSALAFQMHDGTLALTGAKQQTFKKNTERFSKQKEAQCAVSLQNNSGQVSRHSHLRDQTSCP